MLRYEVSVHAQTNLQILRYAQNDILFNVPNTMMFSPHQF